MPIDGPGRIQQLQGPSYIWAILNDSRVADGRTTARSKPAKQASVHLSSTSVNTAIPGTSVTVEDLSVLGFRPLELAVLDEIELPFGKIGVTWSTIG